MRTIGPVNWAIIMWSLVGRGLLVGVVGPKPMVPIILFPFLFFSFTELGLFIRNRNMNENSVLILLILIFLLHMVWCCWGKAFLKFISLIVKLRFSF